MKNNLTTALALTITLFAPVVQAAGPAPSVDKGSCMAAYLLTLPVATVDKAEIDGLVFTREEEKLARDVYQGLGKVWNLRIFGNIALAEQQHMDAIKFLLDRYGITDPAGTNAAGVFTNPVIQGLYNELMAKGRVSMELALEAGATIEDLDISDVERNLAETNNADIAAVYQNLAKGSRNHIRSFVANLSALGVTYTPEYLSAADYAAILAQPAEHQVVYDASGNPVNLPVPGCGTGSGNQNGSGNGNGNGNQTGNGKK